MQVWHPRALFHTVELDGLEVFPTSGDGNKKFLIIGGSLNYYIMSIPVPNEAVVNIASILFERWIEIFGPLVRLFSDLEKPFVSSIVQHFCSRVGTRKIFKISNSPQTDGCF